MKSPFAKGLNSGQALIVVLLVMAVVLTTSLSVSSRSILDVSTTTYEEDALRAFSAAEAGVEKALLSGQSVPVTYTDSTNSVKFETPIVYTPAGNTFKYPTNLQSGEIATIWFVSHDSSTNALVCTGSNICTRANRMDICWGNSSTITANTPALDVSIFYDNDVSHPAVASPNNFSTVRVKRST